MKRNRNPNGRPMNACERGNWIDTEGSIEETMLRVYQTERQPLEDYCTGAILDGVPCTIGTYKVKYKGKEILEHRAVITGMMNMAKEIGLTRKCIRTQARKQQIQNFRQFLQKPRKLPKGLEPIITERIRKAKKLLGE